MKQNAGKAFSVPKIAFFTLSAILAVALLVHSITFFCLNLLFDPFSTLQEHEIALRLSGRNLAETICSIFGILYEIGLLVFAMMLLRLDRQVSTKKLCLFLVLQLAIMGICTIPFALIDSVASADYFIPILSVIPPLLIVCILYFMISRIPYRKTA